MMDHKKTETGFFKRGLVFCMMGVMAVGLAACGGKNFNADSAQPMTKTEASQSADKQQTGTKTETENADGMKNDDANTMQDQKNNATGTSSKKGTTKNSKSSSKSTGTQKTNKSGSTKKNKTNN